MSTPNLKNRPEDIARISGVYFSVETPSKRVAQRMAYLTVVHVYYSSRIAILSSISPPYEHSYALTRIII